MAWSGDSGRGGGARADTSPAAELPLSVFEHGPAVAPAGDDLTVASYNIKFGKNIAEAIKEIQEDEHLAAADLLLLQEMDDGGVDTIARALGMNAVYVPASRDEDGWGFGNAILFRGPLADLRALQLPHRHPLNGQVRVALFATVRWKGEELRVACVHLETPPLTLTHRVEQAETVLDAVNDSGLPLIIAGDFNSITVHEARVFGRQLRGAGLRRVNTGPEPTAERSLLGVSLYKGRPDHIFVRDLAIVAGGVVTNTTASDHRPIWAVLEW